MKFKKLLTVITLLLLTTTVGLVQAGISVTVIEVSPIIYETGETATYTVTVESITTEDENLQLSIPLHEDLELNWTYVETVIEAGSTLNFGLEAVYTGETEGDFNFTVIGEAWPVDFTYEQAINLSLLETSSYKAYLTLVPEIPSPLIVSILMITIAVTGIFLGRKRITEKRDYSYST